MKYHWTSQFGVLCETGDVKPTNQDRVFAQEAMIDGKHTCLYVVADGVGGLAKGEDISTLATEYFKRWFASLCASNKIDGNLISCLNECVNLVNGAAYEYSMSDGEKMGSTLALLLTVDDTYYVCNVGDSRVYRYNGKKAQQLSYDHSLIADMVRNGAITSQEAESHESKNVITKCLGVSQTVSPYLVTGKMSKRETFVICSDGFYNYADKKSADKIIAKKNIHPQKGVQMLRKTIPQAKAGDNVSIILVKKRKRLSFR